MEILLKLVHIIWSESFIFQLELLVAIIFFICGTANIFIMPIIFNYFIIPRIEKKIGHQLEFLGCYNFELLGNYFARYTDIASYIVVEYTANKLNKKIKRKNKLLALSKVEYDINYASKTEIFWSFTAIINLLLAVLAMISIFIIKQTS